MSLLLPAMSFILGGIMGSFTHAFVCRYNTGMTLGGRSQCFTCGKTLRWYELVPFVSYLIQKGRCRRCHVRIPFDTFLTELASGVLFVGIVIKHGISLESILMAIASLLLVAIFLYYIRHTIIPNEFVYPFACIAFPLLFIEGDAVTLFFPKIGDILAGPLTALLPYGLWQFSKGTWMGLGDAKLMLGLGWILGLSQGFSALVISFWIGAGITLGRMALMHLWGQVQLKWGHKKLTMKSEIPFAPYLIIGFFLTYFFSITVFTS